MAAARSPRVRGAGRDGGSAGPRCRTRGPGAAPCPAPPCCRPSPFPGPAPPGPPRPPPPRPTGAAISGAPPHPGPPLRAAARPDLPRCAEGAGGEGWQKPSGGREGGAAGPAHPSPGRLPAGRRRSARSARPSGRGRPQARLSAPAAHVAVSIAAGNTLQRTPDGFGFFFKASDLLVKTVLHETPCKSDQALTGALPHPPITSLEPQPAYFCAKQQPCARDAPGKTPAPSPRLRGLAWLFRSGMEWKGQFTTSWVLA